jgi:hypothetical protein
MSSRNPRDQRSQASPGSRGRAGGYDARGYSAAPAYDPEPPRRRGAHIGPFDLSPIRVMLLVALIGGLAFLAYSLLIRDALQVPLMATGFAITGIVLGLMALLAVISVIKAGRDGRDGTAVFAALGGGILAFASLMSLAAAAIFSMIWSGTKTG